MTEEAAPRIEERPATYRRKLQLWLLIAFGSVLGLLLVLTIINIVTKMSSRSNAEPVAPQVTTTNQQATVDRQDQFDQLVSARRARSEESRPADLPAETLEDSFNKLSGRKAGSNDGPTATVTPEEKALSQWQHRERLRALDSSKSAWGMQGKEGQSRGVKSIPPSRLPTSTAVSGASDAVSQIDSLNRPFDDSASLEQRRAEVKERIAEAQRLRAALAAQGATALSTSRAGATPGSDAGTLKQDLQRVTSSFNHAPDNVVGYTRSNKYNADIAGKLKVPPGTLIPTTLMRKSISDYTTGSLQAVVSHDVYDISRQYVLFPKGTEINIGAARANNVNEAISNRMAFLVKEAVLPNGNVIDFSRASAVDREGVGAIGDKVNHHFMAQFFGVAAYALVGSNSSYRGTGDDEGSYAGDVGEGMRNEMSPLVQKYINIVPTVTIRPGQSFRVIIEEEMYVEPWSDLYAKYVD